MNAIGDGRRMAETALAGSGRSPASAGARSAIAKPFNPFAYLLTLIHKHKSHSRGKWLRHRFEEIVAQTRASFECEDYRRRRAAAKKGLGK